MPGQALKPRPPTPEGPFLVVGLARSGSAVAQALADRGESVIGADAGRPEEAERLAGSGVEVHLDGDGIELLDRVSTVVKSPGVPREAAVVEAARSRDLPVVGELEVAWRLLPNRFIGVTGTNGKTTVTELLGHIYRTAGEAVAVAGNVGSPLSDLVGRVDPEATVVCECSSFQLEDTEAFAPECGVFLNIAEDHLDRHRTIEHYLAAKLRLFAHQVAGDVAVLSDDDAYEAADWEPDDGAAIHDADWEPDDEADFTAPLGPDDRRWGRGATLITHCSVGGGEREETPDAASGPGGEEIFDLCDMTLRESALFWHGERLLDVAELPLLGRHNVDNAMAAAAAALAMGVEADGVGEGLRSFPGVPHRLEKLGEIDGVTYVNDSKATNPAAAAAAIRSFDAPVRVILGGSLKGGGFGQLVEPVAERCAACYLIGEAAERIERELDGAAGAGVGLDQVAIERQADLDQAVAAAAGDARPGDVVLLAPACASFDAYRDFEARGEHFRALVKARGRGGEAGR